MSTEAISWTDDLALGIRWVDNDHRAILDLINEVLVNLASHLPRDQTWLAFDALIKVTADHFEREEAMLRQAGYPNFDAHQRQHDRMIGRLSAMADLLLDQNGGMPDEVPQFLRHWLLNHVIQSDRDYLPWVRPLAEAGE